MGLDLSVAPLWKAIVSESCDSYKYSVIVRDLNKAILKQGGETYTESRYKRRLGEKLKVRFSSYSRVWEFRKYAARFEGKSINEILKGKCSTKFAHLIKHSDGDGCYLPVDFPKPFMLSYNQPFEPIFICFGSAVRLKKELDLLNEKLKIDVNNLNENIYFKQMDDKFMRLLTRYGINVKHIAENDVNDLVGDSYRREDTLLRLVGEKVAKELLKKYDLSIKVFSIKVQWIRLYQATIKSLQYKLPIIFQ